VHNEGKRHRSPAGTRMHDLGWHGSALDGHWRRAEFRAAGIGAGVGGEFHFPTDSDGHVGFNKAANPNALGALQEAVNKIVVMPAKPAFMINTVTSPICRKPSNSTASIK
jgi:hypothetical protein